MTNTLSKDEKLKLFLKQQMRENLLKIGRRLVIEKGPDFLTARKLSDASSISVGSIYNQFATMDNFIMAENMQTLDELYKTMSIILPDENPYINLNRYVDIFSNYVITNSRLWELLYKSHLSAEERAFPFEYIRRIKKIECLLEKQLYKLLGHLGHAERRVSGQVLTMTLLALSGFLTAKGWENLRQVNKNNICKLMLNTYLAGLASLMKVK